MSLEYQIKTAKTDKYEMDYAVFGKGEKSFIMLPGISVKSVMLSVPAVAAAYNRFSEEYTVYLFDRKKNIKKGYSVENMAEDTADAMKRLGISEAYIFGASQGGMMAQVIAAEHPELVRKIFLASAMAKQNEVTRDVFPRMLALTRERKVRELHRLFFGVVYSDEYLEKYRDVFAFMENNATEDEMKRFEVLTEACVNFDYEQGVKNIKCPIFAVGSMKDKAVGSMATPEIAALTDCGYYMYEGYGHAVYDEAPDYKDRIAAFFGE